MLYHLGSQTGFKIHLFIYFVHFCFIIHITLYTTFKENDEELHSQIK